MSRLLSLFSAALLSIGCVGAANAASYSFSTFDSQITPSVLNQGWWDSNNNAEAVLSGNATTGAEEAQAERRGYFTFDLSGLTLANNESITSVTFAGNAGQVRVPTLGFKTVNLFDVSTDTAILHQSMAQTDGIFADLGSGNSYGTRDFFAADDGEDFEIALNAFAVADIMAAQGDFFSIGAALMAFDVLAGHYVFRGTQLNPFTLNIETQISAVPLPAALPLYGAGLAVMGFIGWRKRQKAAA